MTTQNIYVVRDGVFCPDGANGREYLDGLFARVASQVAAVGDPVDWLVIMSRNLDEFIIPNQNFFYDMLEETMQSAVTSEQSVSLVRGHGFTCGGKISERDLYDRIEEILGQEFEPNHLNDSRIRSSFVAYHLDMR
ncbi:hypothetical protein HOC80_04100 [archaeon]|jgi:hypothetical protein|nr:hypothetical protein [archaeon]MBT4417256.1 hypothetical protein [archaeon]